MSHLKNRFLLVLIILIGFFIRLLTYPEVFNSGRIIFLETDPYYHMWRVFSYIDTFPKTFLFDGYINYPYGALVGWPPLFDQVTALISLILGSGKPGTHLVESIGAFMPAVLGIFSLLTIYIIAKEIFNERVALFGSALTAVLPAHSQISFLGFTDHHIAEVLLYVLIYFYFIKSIKYSNNISPRFAVISGIFVGISILTWQGAPIFTGILLSYVIFQFILDKISGETPDPVLFTGTITFCSALFLILIFYIWTPWQRSITAGTLSYFQPLYLVLSATLMILMGLMERLIKGLKWFYYPVLMLGLFISFVSILNIIIPSLYQNISYGIGYLLRDNPVTGQIVEAQPLFYTFDGKFLGWQVFNNPAWNAFAFSFYFGLIGFFWLLRTCEKDIDKGKTFFIIWTLIVISLAVFQRRFIYMLSVNIAILSGFFADEIIQRVRWASHRSNYEKITVSLAFSVLILLLIAPNIAISYELSQNPPRPSDDWYDSLLWLKENTPEIKNEPQYSIMSWWDYGNWILYISKRPVVANNFQIGGDEAARFFIAQDEAAANTIMNTRKARYVIVDYRMGLNMFREGDQLVLKGIFMAISSFAGTDIGIYLDNNNLPNDNYFETMYARMHVLEGNGLKNYRMIYESKETHYDLFNKPTKNIKIFEYVKGAKITGKSNGTVIISGQIITNQRNIFEYRQAAGPGENGYFEIIVPYSREGTYQTHLLKGYELLYVDSNITDNIDVSENDVINGNIIMVN